MMVTNPREVIGNLRCNGYSQCYTCGYGHDCIYGSVVRTHGILEKIEPCHLPKEIMEQENTQNEIIKIRDILKGRGVSFEP